MPNDAWFSRRSILRFAATLPLAGILPAAAWALDDQEASDLIASVLDDISVVINSGKPEDAMYRDFEKVFTKYGDVPTIARFSLGVAWRSASAGQRTRYTSAFQGYISRKYGKRFRELIGGEIEVTAAKAVKSGFLVTSIAHLKGEAPFMVEWQVSDHSGQNKMFNLYIEGISLLATERTEIAAMLDRRNGNLETLIADLADL